MAWCRTSPSACAALSSCCTPARPPCPSGAVYLGKYLGDENLLSIDMGGTSFDVCMINKGEILNTTEHWENDQRVAIKMVDISSIGAGGGSIAKIDALGPLRAGPGGGGRAPGPPGDRR